MSRELLLSSLGEYSFTELLADGHNFQNLLIGDFIVEDDFIYAAGYDADSPEKDLRVLIFDATDFSSVSLAGEYSDESLAVNPQSASVDMLKVGDLLYVASQGNGLFVIDISEPASPAASLLYPGSHFTGFAVRDESTIYVSFDEEMSISNRGIHIFDIGDPASPVIVDTLYEITVFDMLYEDGFLYVYGPGLAVLDASSPSSLSVVSTISFPASSSTSIAYRNGFVYSPITDVSAGLQGMTIVDVRNPASLQRVDDIAGIGHVTEIAVHDDRLYATSSTGSGSSFMLVSFEIGDDGRLQMVDSRSTPGAFYLRYENERVYLANAIQLAAYDANALHKKPEHLGFLATDKAANLVEVSGGVAYVANDTELLAIDVTDPGNALTVLGGVSVTDWINDIEIIGSYAYLANATEGIKIVDISNPSDLKVVGSNADLVPLYDPVHDQTVSREAVSIDVQDQSAYVVIGGYPYVTIGVFAIDDPSAPTVVHAADFPYPVADIVVDGDTLYGVDRAPNAASFYIADVANEPEHVATIDLFARAIAQDGVHIYTTSGTAGLSILDASSEKSPVLLGNALSLGIGNAVSVVGGLAYVANAFGMVEVYDVTDKTQPELIGHYPVSGVVKDVFATEEYVFAVNGVGLIVEPAVRLHSALK